MRYVGGKSRILRHLVPHITGTGRSIYVEPFVGGGAVLARVARQFQTVYAFDAHPDLILMYQALQAGWTPPETVTKEDYAALRDADPSALRGFVGFGCSFGGKWWGGHAHGGGRNHAGESARNVMKMVSSGVADPHVHYLQADALEILTSDVLLGMAPDAVVYCDPPYEETTGYKGTDTFDHAAFWRACQTAADAGAVVLVSEYSPPPVTVHTEVAWSGQTWSTLQNPDGGSRARPTEHLYRVIPKKDWTPPRSVIL